MSRRGYADDLRAWVIAAIEGGSSAREASRRFLVSGSSAARWAERRRRTGSFRAKADTGHSRSPLRAHREWLLGQIAHEPDLNLAVLRQRLVQQRALRVGLSSIWRFFARHGITFKKTLRAAEQQRADGVQARARWKQAQRSFEPQRLVFVDQTATTTRMARLYGRCPRGEPLMGYVPHGY